MNDLLTFSDEVAAAKAGGGPVVALESTIIAHGLPWPENMSVAAGLQDAVRAAGATPAIIGLLDGRVHVGLSGDALERLAQARDCVKVSRRDLGTVIGLGLPGATTVAGTMYCAALAGIEMFATGGIGGVHRGGEDSLDVSADLRELGQSPVTVVCAGAKSILDLPRTLEVLETEGVPVLGYRTDRLPAFHYRDSGLGVDRRVEDAVEAAAIIRAQRRLGLQGGLLIVNPIPEADELPRAEVEGWIATALAEARRDGVTGKRETPYLLRRLAELSDGRTVAANRALAIHNADVAARIAVALA
ncbi:MAG: pseudouridine-5'-phosphate glycosidase [Rhodospirillales bacterium]